MSCEKVVKLKKNRLGRGFIGMRFSFREWILEQYKVNRTLRACADFCDPTAVSRLKVVGRYLIQLDDPL